ncbi:MAG: hypothetical protein MZW92_25525 [Comamonadaceae bacterium]|nr:hypothetical protein [Comamonadaceae bacterium]
MKVVSATNPEGVWDLKNGDEEADDRQGAGDRDDHARRRHLHPRPRPLGDRRGGRDDRRQGRQGRSATRPRACTPTPPCGSIRT